MRIWNIARKGEENGPMLLLDHTQFLLTEIKQQNNEATTITIIVP